MLIFYFLGSQKTGLLSVTVLFSATVWYIQLSNFKMFFFVIGTEYLSAKNLLSENDNKGFMQHLLQNYNNRSLNSSNFHKRLTDSIWEYYIMFFCLEWDAI